MITTEMLATGRAAAESLMTATCTITRDAGESTWNEDTGKYSGGVPETVYTGPCKVQDSGRSASDADAGEIHAGLAELELHLPIAGSGGVRRDDDVVIDSNPNDPALVGRRFVVRAPHAATWKTARRLPIEAVL